MKLLGCPCLPALVRPSPTRSLFLSHFSSSIPSYKVRSEENLKRKEDKMIPQQWTPPCNNQCTLKYAALMQIPWRVFCKKGCDSDGETWEECLGECEEICYKDPVLKDRQWSAYIDRSPGAASYSEECFHACISGCGYKFDIPPERVKEVQPSRPCKPPPVVKLTPPPVGPKPTPECSEATTNDVPCTSA